MGCRGELWGIVGILWDDCENPMGISWEDAGNMIIGHDLVKGNSMKLLGVNQCAMTSLIHVVKEWEYHWIIAHGEDLQPLYCHILGIMGI